VENKPVSIGASATFVYDGDGTRVKKTEGGETVLYVNKYYEKNLTTAVVTTSYYLGDRLIAQREGETLRYIHQDHLTGTSVMSSSSGVLISGIKYYPYGSARSGSVPTDKQFTGQRLDDTGLYYYGARYYDPVIGRFISADTVVQDLASPQTLNRYSYVANNPLKYIDPSGQVMVYAEDDPAATSVEVQGYWEEVGEILEDHPEFNNDIKTQNPVTDINTANSVLNAIEQSIGDDEILGIEEPEAELPVGDSSPKGTLTEGDKKIIAGVAIEAISFLSVGVPLTYAAIVTAATGVGLPAAAGILVLEEIIMTPITILAVYLIKTGLEENGNQLFPNY
jgi:RHS repeat-associated protein